MRFDVPATPFDLKQFAVNRFRVQVLRFRIPPMRFKIPEQRYDCKRRLRVGNGLARPLIGRWLRSPEMGMRLNERNVF